MAQLVRINLQDPQDALDTYGAGALIRLERDTTSAMTGASEITTIAVVAGTTEYEYRDQTGVAGTHHGRWRLSKASPSVAADYSGYSSVFRYGDPGGQVITLETIKTWADIDDTTDDGWLALAVGAVNRAIIGGSGVGIDLGSSPDTTRTYRSSQVIGGRRLWVPGGIRAFTAVETGDGTTWTAVTTSVEVGPYVHERPYGEPGDYIEVKPEATVALDASYYVRITGTAFATFGWDAWPLDLVQAAVSAVQRMALERDRQGQYPTETNALRYLDPNLLRSYRARYFPAVR